VFGVTGASTVTGAAGPIAILGAGRVGTALARLALAAGRDVFIAGSIGPERISQIVDVAARGAVPAAAAEAARIAPVVVLAMPLARVRTVWAEALEGRTVVDAMNYWPPVDGRLDEFEGTGRATSEVVRDMLGVPKLVKTFNHMGYHELEASARPGQSAGRMALAVAGDAQDAVTQVSALVEEMGFDPVFAGSLAASGRLEPGSELFGVPLSREAMLGVLEREPASAR
jgi:8-hydroxy-5-deazaflavin:NADPH oxidoreductase